MCGSIPHDFTAILINFIINKGKANENKSRNK